MKVLLIEDDIDVAETIASVIEAFFPNSRIERITDGVEFRRGAWRTGGWSLVVLDLMMPGITGFDVCEQLRNHKETKGVPILALTGYDTLQNEEKIKAAGATGYMAKPFEIKKLKSEIERITKKAA